MNCPSCNAALEPNARFCGVCGHQVSAAEQARAAGAAGRAAQASPAGHAPSASSASPAGHASSASSAGAQTIAETKRPRPASAVPGAGGMGGGGHAMGKASEPFNPGGKSVDPFLGQVLNNRFKIESKIGEGGFGAVYRGVQLSNGRKVALKLLHPEMTKDKNLVARFRREGLVLCNLKDAHTITTYDFDQTSDGTLYIAMELLEGKSLHQIFQAQAPLDWRRVFKIIGEMCSSLAEAHAQGIVHRDLKPENVYLEARAGNLEFVKILDFGIAKVMRGEAIDPQSPQLTATGQTLGTLEYMSPEQLMGKSLDGRSDVYALGVVAYEMITKRLPFPDAKGPAGLITAQLRQTPQPPSKANPAVICPPIADKIILKCLEKDRNNRYADVTALATAVQEALASAASTSGPGPAMEEPRRPGSGPMGEASPSPSPSPFGSPMQLPHLPQSVPSSVPSSGPSSVPQSSPLSSPHGSAPGMGPMGGHSTAVPAVMPPAGSSPYPVPQGPPLAPMPVRSPTSRPLTGPVVGHGHHPGGHPASGHPASGHHASGLHPSHPSGSMSPGGGIIPPGPNTPHHLTPPHPMAPVGVDSQRTWVVVMVVVVLLGAIAGAALAFLL